MEDPSGLPGWSTLTATALFYNQPDWCRFVDSDRVAEARYGALYPTPQAQQPIAGLLAHHAAAETNPYYRADVALGAAVPDLVTLGGRRGYLSGPLLDPTLDPAQAAAALRVLVEAALGCWPNLQDWWWPYLSDRDANIVSAAGGSSCERHLVDAECVLPIAAGGFEDYVASVASRQGRTNIRRELRRFAESGLVVSQNRLLGCDLEWLGVLSANVQHKYGEVQSATQMAGILRRQAEHADAASVVFTCGFPDQQDPVGFSVAFRTDQALFLRLVGFDYDRLPNVGAYAQLAIYEPVRFAQEHGLTVVHLGGSSWEAKIRRGAHVRGLWAVTSVQGLDRGHSDTVAHEIAESLPVHERDRWWSKEVG